MPARVVRGQLEARGVKTRWTGAALAVLTVALVAQGQSGADEVSNRVVNSKPPTPVYPAAAAAYGLEGRCEVSFLVTNYTQVKIVGVACSHSIFCVPSSEAVASSTFRIIDATGASEPGRRENLTYPLSYRLEGSLIPQEIMDGLALKRCESVPTS